LSVASFASADPSTPQKAMASQFFDDAEKLVASDKSAEACPKYAESQRLDPQLGTLLHLAECYERIGRTASAWTTFKDATEIAARKKDYREVKARARVADLESKLSMLVVTVADKEPLSIDVRQDGEVVGRAAWGLAVPVDPGRHTITARAPGYKAWSTSVGVPPNVSSTRVTVPELETDPGQASAAPDATATQLLASTTGESPTSGRGSTQRTLGYVVGAVGVVGVGLGAVFGLQMKSKLSDRDGVCGAAYLCTTNDQAEQIKLLTSEARNAATLSSVSFAIGGTALMAGITLLLTAPSKAPKPASTIDVRPWIGPNSAGAAMGGRW
jgi:hypothetical protein